MVRIVDTAFVLAAGEALAILEARLAAILKTLGALAEKHRRTVMPARTRFQPAVATTFGAKVAGWAAPHSSGDPASMTQEHLRQVRRN